MLWSFLTVAASVVLLVCVGLPLFVIDMVGEYMARFFAALSPAPLGIWAAKRIAVKMNMPMPVEGCIVVARETFCGSCKDYHYHSNRVVCLHDFHELKAELAASTKSFIEKCIENEILKKDLDAYVIEAREMVAGLMGENGAKTDG